MSSNQSWTNELGNNAKTFREDLERAKATGVPENKLLVEVSGSHSVNCSEKLFIPHISKNRVVSWVFTVTSSLRCGYVCQLKHVFTLDPNLPEFSIINVSAIDSPILTLLQGCQEWQNTLKHSPEYKVTVQFVASCYGNFYQRLVFGFGTDGPKVVRHLGVMVAPETSLVKQLSYERTSTEDNELNWLNKYELVTYNGKKQKGPDQSKYKLPPNIKSGLDFGAFDHMDDTLTKENYRTRLHTLLHIEEHKRRKQMTRLNLNCQNVLNYTTPSEEHIEKSCIELPINPDILEDANHLINRSSRALIKLVPPSRALSGDLDPVLYEVIVLALKKDSIIFLTSKALNLVLKEANNSSKRISASVCFRFVDTYKYMHSAIDRINLECVFPNNPLGLSLEWDIGRHDFLNKPQATALSHILDPRPKPPLLIFGPFGTGKTRTIAEAVKELCRLHSGNPDENLRILICTHSNSAADHYIVNYLHPFFTSSQLGSELCTMLRICWEDRFLKTVSSTVLKYCFISQETGKFAVPPRPILDKYRIVVTTLVTADVLTGLPLPPGYFSHVFIDEAAQAMEAETLIPLCLCLPSTRVVLAGDHLQLGAIVDSPVARRLALDRSLLVRLYEFYPSTSSCKLLLLENYRAYQEIVDIPSKLFYEGTLVAHKTRPPSSIYPVHFYGVLGKEARAPDIPSYYNMAEAAEISERVEWLVNEWLGDGVDDGSVEESICVLAPYTAQVREIRQLLRKKNLGQVRVEGVNNVQGLEFDAIFISTVHTTFSITVETIDRQDMGFLSDPRLLNTAVTRAKYQLVFVGDPNALCGAGDCKVCWKTILSKCSENGTFNYRLPFEKVIEYTKSPNQHETDNETINSTKTNNIESMPSAKPYLTTTATATTTEFEATTEKAPVAASPHSTAQRSNIRRTSFPDAIPNSTFPSPNVPAPAVPDPTAQGRSLRGSSVPSPRTQVPSVPGPTAAQGPNARGPFFSDSAPNSTFQSPQAPAPSIPGPTAPGLSLPGSSVPGQKVQVPSFPGSAVSIAPSNSLFQSMVPRPGVVSHVVPPAFNYRTLQPMVDPSGRLVYPTNQIFQGQSVPVMPSVPGLPFTTVLTSGPVIGPHVNQIGGQVRFVGQAPIGFPTAPNQPPWQRPSQQFMTTPWGLHNHAMAASQASSVHTDSPLSRCSSGSPSVQGNSPTVRGMNSSSFPGVAGVSNPPCTPPKEERRSSQTFSPVNGIVPPSGYSTEYIVQAIMYDIHCRQQMLSEEEKFLVELSTDRTFPKDLSENLMKQIQVMKSEKQLSSNRLSLHEVAAKQLGVDCTISVSAAMNQTNEFLQEKMLVSQLKRLSLESDDEIKQLLSQGSMEERSTHSDDFEDSDTEEWFLARREDPLVKEYIKAFESFAEAFYQRSDSAQSYQNISAEDFRAEAEHLESNWSLKPRCNTTYIGNAVHQEYEDEGRVFDKLLKNELILCSLEVTGVNTAMGKVIAGDVKAMLMGSSMGDTRNLMDVPNHDITISTRVEMNRAFHGDIVAVEVKDKKSARLSGRVVYILKKVNPREFVCTVDDQDSSVMIPVDKKNPNIFVMQSREHRDLKGVSVFSFRDGEARCRALVPSHQAKGCLFLVTVLEWGTNYRLPLGIVRKFLKQANDLAAILPLLAAEHGIRVNQPDEVINEVRNIFSDTFQVPEREWLSRAYRYNNAFTIDCGESLGLELDDAISVIKEKGGSFSIGVHVSDVSYFVPKDSYIDKAAAMQGSSLYPQHHSGGGCGGESITMLPSRLSHNLCSLLPRQDRLAVSIIFRMDRDGNVIKPPDIHRSVVSSCCSLTFKECDDILAGKSPRNVPGNIKEDLYILDNLTRKIALRQVRLGCITGAVDLIQNTQSKGSQIIEQLMIMANASVAQRLLLSPKTKSLALLRRQLQPKYQQSEVLNKWCSDNEVVPNGSLTLQNLPQSEAVGVNSEVKVELSCLGHISTAVNARDLTQLTEALLKCDNTRERLEAHSRFYGIQERSQYIVSAHSSGPQLKHFSLGQECYTHFTSPLRRYFDLVVHRCLLALIYDKPFPYTLKELQDICIQCQITSTRANSFEKSFMSVSLADLLCSSQQLRPATIEKVSSERLTLNCNMDDNCRPYNRNIKLTELGASKVDVESEQELVMTWNRHDVQCFVVPSQANHSTPPRPPPKSPSNSYFVKVPASSWITFIQEVTRGKFKRINRQWSKVNSSSLAVHLNPPTPKTDYNEGKWADIYTTRLTTGGKVNVLLGSEVRRGFLQPVIKGVQISPSFFSCASHRHNPESVFCSTFNGSTELLYQDIEHYKSVMMPLVEMESAAGSIQLNRTCIQLCGVECSWGVSGNAVCGSFKLRKSLCESHAMNLSPGDYICIRNEKFPSLQTTEKETKSCIVIHGRISELTEHSDRISISIDITEPANTFSAEILQSHAQKYTIEVIPQCSRYKSMIEVLRSINKAPEIIRSIVIHRDLPGTPAKLDIPVLMHFPLDIDQVAAVKSALNSPFTVIYGQPGTGKTWTAVAITCHFINLNWQARAGQVMVCAPNNKALDVIAKMLVKIPSVNVLRVYSHDDELQPFVVIDECKPLALHLRVRRTENPHSTALRMCLHEIRQLRQRLELCESADRDNLQKKLLSKKQKLTAILDAAEGYEFTQTSVHVILCTCAESGSPRILKFTNISQCIVDECNMCFDAELLVPLVIAGQQCQHMVLIGDPKQLVPVLYSKTAAKHGLNRSLFEDLIDSRTGKQYECRLLRMQFRMHPSLRSLSSELFYKDNYKPVFDAPQVTDSAISMEGLWSNSQEYRHVFCHVGGEECVNQTGDPDADWWNCEEVLKVVAVVNHIKSFGFTSEHICIISPYLSQRRRIHDALGAQTVQILSPTESQGTEHQFVIFSTVRSSAPEHARKIGCLGDVHQLNVIFTRARLGLIIIGNRNYLNTIPTWRRLLLEYDTYDCIVDGSVWP